MKLLTLKKKPLRIFGLILVLSQPVFTALHYGWNAAKGAYSPEADTIAIPIVGEWFFWLVLSPVVIWGIWKITRNYTRPVSLFVINDERPAWSVKCSLIFLLAFIVILFSRLDAFLYFNLPTFIDLLLTTYLLANLRAAAMKSAKH